MNIKCLIEHQLRTRYALYGKLLFRIVSEHPEFDFSESTFSQRFVKFVRLLNVLSDQILDLQFLRLEL